MNDIDSRAVWPGWKTVRLIGRGSYGAVWEIEQDVLGEKENEYRLRVTGEDQASRLLSSLITGGATVIAFELTEPSLHEIFVRTVGGADEE